MLKTLLVAFLLFAGAATRIALAVPAQMLTLSQALTEANAHNREIAAARTAVDAARAQLTQAAPSPLQAQIAPGVTQDVPNGLGTIQTFAAGASAEFSPALGAQRRVARSAVAVAQAQLAQVQRDVDQRVIAAYYGLASAQAATAAAKQSASNARELIHAAELRVRVGAVGKFEVLRAQVEQRRVESELLRARSTEATQRIALNILLARDMGVATEVEITTISPSTSDIEALYTKAASLDPLIVQYRAAFDQAIAQGSVARDQRLPSLALQGGYLFQRAPGAGDAIARGGTASASLSFPLLDFGTIRGAVQEANAREAAARAQLEGRQAQLHAELSQYALQIDSAQARMALARTSLVQAQEGLRIAQFGYRMGALGILDVLSARNELAAAQSEATQASADLGAAIARLELVIGANTSP